MPLVKLPPPLNPGTASVHGKKTGGNFWRCKADPLPPHLAESSCRQFDAASKVRSDRLKTAFSCKFSPEEGAAATDLPSKEAIFLLAALAVCAEASQLLKGSGSWFSPWVLSRGK